MEIIQITGEQATRMLTNLPVDHDSIYGIDVLIRHWKNQGFIKQSALEKAKELRAGLRYSPSIHFALFEEICSLYEKALEEK